MIQWKFIGFLYLDTVRYPFLFTIQKGFCQRINVKSTQSVVCIRKRINVFLAMWWLWLCVRSDSESGRDVFSRCTITRKSNRLKVMSLLFALRFLYFRSVFYLTFPQLCNVCLVSSKTKHANKTKHKIVVNKVECDVWWCKIKVIHRVGE